MASYTGTSAATRGSVVLNGTPVPSPSPAWLDEARDNLNLIAPSPITGADFNEAVEASWVTLLPPSPSPSPAPGSYQAVCSRYFAAFSTTGVPTQATSIQLYIHIITNADNDLRIVKASAPSTTGPGVTGGNYKAIPGLTAGTGMGGLVTDYYGPGGITPSIGWNAIPLNATAISDFNSQPALQIAVVDSAYDYDYTEPTFPSIQRTGISYHAPYSPYLLIDTGIDQWVLSIDPSVTSKVNPAPKTNIRLVNRVGAYTTFRATTGGANSLTNPGCQIPFPGTTPIYCVKPYSNLQVGDFVFNDYALTTPFNGGGLYFALWFRINDSGWTDRLYQISSIGEITDISGVGACLF